jgi:mannose-6-phosphate isomerase-like protein (cupin superfamily)
MSNLFERSIKNDRFRLNMERTTMQTQKVNIAEKFTLFNEHFTPKIIGEANGQYVKIAKIRGEFVWHSHEAEDELFLVFKGVMTIEMRDRTIQLGEGEMFIVPKGVEHRTLAEDETYIMMIEPKSTAHSGDVQSDLTVPTEAQAWI